MKRPTTERNPWVIVAAAFFAMLFNPSVCYAVGVLHVRLVEIYPQNKYAVAWLGSITTALSSLSGPIASLIINVYDCRTCVVFAGILGFVGFVSSCFIQSLSWMFVTYALLVGLGIGLANTSAIVILGYYFQKDTSLAVGITVTGTGLGIFVYPALTDFLLTTYGLRGTFLILGALVFQSCVFGMLLRPSKFERNRHLMFLSGRNKRRQIIHAICGGHHSQCESILTNIPFLLLVFSYFTVSISIASTYLYLPDYFVQRGASNQVASFAVSMSGIGSIISRILTAFAANDPEIGCLLLLAGITGIHGILAVSINLLTATSSGQLAFGFLFGLYTGGSWVVCGPVTLSILGTERLSTGFGLLMLAVGSGYLIGPPLAGLILQINDQYYSVFLFCAAMCFISSLCTFLTAVNKSRSSETTESTISCKQTESDIKVALNDTSLHYEKNYHSDDSESNVIPELEKLNKVGIPA